MFEHNYDHLVTSDQRDNGMVPNYRTWQFTSNYMFTTYRYIHCTTAPIYVFGVNTSHMVVAQNITPSAVLTVTALELRSPTRVSVQLPLYIHSIDKINNKTVNIHTFVISSWMLLHKHPISLSTHWVLSNRNLAKHHAFFLYISGPNQNVWFHFQVFFWWLFSTKPVSRFYHMCRVSSFQPLCINTVSIYFLCMCSSPYPIISGDS